MCPRGTGRLQWHCPGVHGAGRHGRRGAQHRVLAFLSPVHALSSSGEGLSPSLELRAPAGGHRGSGPGGTCPPKPAARLSPGRVLHPAASRQDSCPRCLRCGPPSYKTQAPVQAQKREPRRWRGNKEGRRQRCSLDIHPGREPSRTGCCAPVILTTVSEGSSALQGHTGWRAVDVVILFPALP